MANQEQLRIIEQGVKAWNAWRREHPSLLINLNQASFVSRDLNGINLSGAELWEVDFSGAHLAKANLSGAELRNAHLTSADLKGANLKGADLSGADLTLGADLTDVDLTDADLILTDLNKAQLNGSDFTGATIGGTVFADNDLSIVRGLDNVRHIAPSSIDISTLYKSSGKIPEVFLRGAGVPEEFITYAPSLVGRALEFYSCFISYSHRDEEFARRLHSAMQSENMRVWFAPEDMKAGRKLHEEIFRAIQIHDKLLLVLSEDSMKSEWVLTEIRRARKAEREENRRKLFPVRLVDFEAIQKWKCFDADSGNDLAVELREYYIPDFSNWKDHDAFTVEFKKLLRDLRFSE